MYDIDLFETPPDVIAQLHSQGSAVICYFSAGTWEEWREDAGSFPDSLKGKEMNEWEGEQWLDISQLSALRPLMESRMNIAVAKGCDGVEPDNVDAWINEVPRSGGGHVNAADQLAFNTFLATAAHSRNLSVGLKNDLEQITELLAHFDFAVNEQCNQFSECGLLEAFIADGKAVFGVEYCEDSRSTDFCDEMVDKRMSWMLRRKDLSPLPRLDCFKKVEGDCDDTGTCDKCKLPGWAVFLIVLAVLLPLCACSAGAFFFLVRRKQVRPM